ncbi:hypothetical protein [Streptomyces sp. RB17]|uniref:hypothetical protein n=1 Tax=Streptomyces sp. RB17 TaxID=2585197 RepID=UPI00129505C2|nr:hypothetical protein [Streptomyces sp. RB17]
MDRTAVTLADVSRSGVAARRLRLTERYTTRQLLTRAGLVALPCYCLVVGIRGGWTPALVCLPLLYFGLMPTGGGGVLCRG